MHIISRHAPEVKVSTASKSVIAYLPGIISRRTVDRRDFPSHGSDVGTELAAMMDEIEEREPRHAAERRFLHHDAIRRVELCDLRFPGSFRPRSSAPCPPLAAWHRTFPPASFMLLRGRHGPPDLNSHVSSIVASTNACPATNAVSSIAERDFGSGFHVHSSPVPPPARASWRPFPCPTSP